MVIVPIHAAAREREAGDYYRIGRSCDRLTSSSYRVVLWLYSFQDAARLEDNMPKPDQRWCVLTVLRNQRTVEYPQIGRRFHLFIESPGGCGLLVRAIIDK